jgi:hypothetical protein
MVVVSTARVHSTSFALYLGLLFAKEVQRRKEIEAVVLSTSSNFKRYSPVSSLLSVVEVVGASEIVL